MTTPGRTSTITAAACAVMFMIALLALPIARGAKIGWKKDGAALTPLIGGEEGGANLSDLGAADLSDFSALPDVSSITQAR